MKILIIGGYGSFGTRLCRLLDDDARITLLIAGRSLQKAYALCDALTGNAGRVALFFDRDADVGTQIADIMPDLIVDASGPFQCYGKEPYRIVKACLEHGIDYMDFADDAAFVHGFAQFDAEAKARGLVALTGASSLPALSVAVARHLARDMSKVTAIIAGIAPSPHAGLGISVVRAIASYAGKPIKLWRNGSKEVAYAMTESLRYTIAPPGSLPLRNLRFSLVNAPDFEIFPALWPDLQSIWIGAATVPAFSHRMLNLLAWLVRLHVLPSLAWLSRVMHHAVKFWSWGEHRGGMFVAVDGLDKQGRAIGQSWHLLAERSDGLQVPATPIAALVLRYVDGMRPLAGARAAHAELDLEYYQNLFQQGKIQTGERQRLEPYRRLTLYQRILGDAWSLLPPQLQAMHDCHDTLEVGGRADIECGTGFWARKIAAVVGLPETGRDIPVQVVFSAQEQGERWQRRFGNKVFSSVMTEGAGKSERLIEERFGPFRFGLALVWKESKLYLVMRRWSFCRIPLPPGWAPVSNAYEHVEEGRYCFDVEIRQRFIGLIVRYRGWLARD